jgi:hypothetical protein
LLYPLTTLSEERAAKHGFSYEIPINEKKDICTTAIISIPIIFPEAIDSTETMIDNIPMVEANLEIDDASL